MGYHTPGAYYETVDASAATIAGIRTDIAGFVGIAERGAIDVPVPVESWRQFQARFGGCTGAGYLAYAVRAFFENGGRRCWVVRIASRDPLGGASVASATVLGGAVGADVWRIEASSAGTWGNAVTTRFVQTRRAQTVADLSLSTPDYTAVANTDGFVRGTLVRLSQQAGGVVLYKVVSDVDAARRRLLLVAVLRCSPPLVRLLMWTPSVGCRRRRPGSESWSCAPTTAPISPFRVPRG
jgi:hypothetical protein